MLCNMEKLDVVALLIKDTAPVVVSFCRVFLENLNCTLRHHLVDSS